MDNATLSVDKLGLSIRAVNALKRNGVNSLIDLVEYSEEDLYKMQGLGKACIDEIMAVINRWISLSEEELKKAMEEFGNHEMHGGQMQIGEYIGTLRNSERLIKILNDYFVDSPRKTLDEIGREMNVTRERARQLIMNTLNKVRRAIMRGEIDCSQIDIIREAAARMTEINMINVSDDVFGKVGLIRIVAALLEDELKILNTRKLNGEWIVRKEDNVSKIIDSLSTMLYNRDLPMRIEDVLTIFPIPEEMMLSIENVIEKDGYVTLSTNKIATGTGRHEVLRNYLLKLDRPVSIEEAARANNLTESQARGRFTNGDYFVNVGRSVYELVDVDYSGLSVSEIAKKILLAENRALKLSTVISYVQRHRDMDDWEISRELLYCAQPVVYRHDEYILLNEWGLDKIETPKSRHYDIKLEDAIMDVINEMEGIFTVGDVANQLRNKFGGAVSTNTNSIKQTLCVLAQQEKIARVGYNTGCYRRARI